MKITIDVSDFYLDETELEQGLKEYITREAIREINKAIEKKVEDHITRSVKNEIEQKLIYKINKQVEEIIATENIIINGKPTPFNEHIKTSFQSNSGWNSASDALKKLANKFGEEMKNRYDLLFASQIVAKMNESGLLKEDVAKLLIDNKDKH